MRALTLHYHPLSSCCHKVLIALDILDIQVEKRLLNLGDSAERSAYMALWPMGKMPLLVDQGRPVPETSIIIEHLQSHHAHPGHTLVPHDPDKALEVRLWDRLLCDGRPPNGRAKMGSWRCVQHGRLRCCAVLVLCHYLRPAVTATRSSGSLLRSFDGSSISGTHH